MSSARDIKEYVRVKAFIEAAEAFGISEEETLKRIENKNGKKMIDNWETLDKKDLVLAAIGAGVGIATAIYFEVISDLSKDLFQGVE